MYIDDKKFIEKYHKIVELSSENSRVLTSPTLQGRVITSSTSPEGYSFGWINYKLIESGEILAHCNNFGGEDRFWVGPEGGQFSIFFPKGTDFGFDDWQAPSVIDNEEWDVKSHSPKSVTYSTKTDFINTSGYTLKTLLERTISLNEKNEIEKLIGIPLNDLECVAFTSENHLTNLGDFEWTEETGMLSIWTLGQFIPSDKNWVYIPYKEVEAEKINDIYFGKISEDRLTMKDGVLEFKVDGKCRGKIGTPPAMTIPTAYALDKENGTLTIVKFNFESPNNKYVNSMWEEQAEPFKGDVINSYNDGPLEDGTVMGGFYEIETSSPAAALAPTQTITHTSTTIHLKGDIARLEEIFKSLVK